MIDYQRLHRPLLQFQFQAKLVAQGLLNGWTPWAGIGRRLLSSGRNTGVRARLYVNGAAQPALIVNDLKRGVTTGAIGLWIGPGTEAYFRNLRITTN